MTDQATKRPWRVGRAHGIKGVYNIMCDEISDEEDIANARLIVKAVNCHDELVEALKLALKSMKECDERQHIKRHMLDPIIVICMAANFFCSGMCALSAIIHVVEFGVDYCFWFNIFSFLLNLIFGIIALSKLI